MPIDEALALLARPIEEDTSWPRPLCPQCRQGHLAFQKPDEFENAHSARFRRRNEEYWDPDMIFGSFEVAAICTNDDCNQRTSAVGTYRVELAEGLTQHDQIKWHAFYSIEYFSPPLELIRAPKSAPDEVQEGITRASRVLFADPGLAATALRATIERYLTTEGIPAEIDGTFMPVRKRIDDWAAQTGKTEIADLFHAIRWIGNEGTHEVSDLTAAEVIEDAAILDEALHRIFLGADIDARAQAINATRGHPRP